MRAITIFVTCVLFTLFNTSLYAHDDHGQVERVNIQGIGMVEYQRLFEMLGENGETMDAFAARVAPRLIAYSDSTGYEACGMFARHEDGRFGIVIGTNRARLVCANFNGITPNEMASTQVSIHSHGLGEARLTASDLKILKIRSDARSQSMYGKVFGQDRERFSRLDLSGPAGYLAIPNGLLYHDGNGIATAIPLGN